MRSVLVLWLSSLLLLLTGACAGRQRPGTQYQMNPLPTASDQDLTVQEEPVKEVQADPIPEVDQPDPISPAPSETVKVPSDGAKPWSMKQVLSVDFDIMESLRHSAREAQARIDANVRRQLAAQDAWARAQSEKPRGSHVAPSPPNNDEIVASLTRPSKDRTRLNDVERTRSSQIADRRNHRRDVSRDRKVTAASHAKTELVVIPADSSASSTSTASRMPLDIPPQPKTPIGVSAQDPVPGPAPPQGTALFRPTTTSTSMLSIIIFSSLLALGMGLIGGFLLARRSLRRPPSLAETPLYLPVEPPVGQTGPPDASQEASDQPPAPASPASQVAAPSVPQGTDEEQWYEERTNPDIPQLACGSDTMPVTDPVALTPAEKQRLDETPLDLRPDTPAKVIVEHIDN